MEFWSVMSVLVDGDTYANSDDRWLIGSLRESACPTRSSFQLAKIIGASAG